MPILEKELEDMICNNPQEVLYLRGLTTFNPERVFRQLNLGAYGVADVVGFDFDIDYNGDMSVVHITVYELKKDMVGADTLAQVGRYIAGLSDYFEQYEVFGDCEVKFYPVLIGKSIDLSNSFVYLARLVKNLSVFTYELRINGLFFNKVDPFNYAPTSLDRKGYGTIAKMSKRDWALGRVVQSLNN